MKLSKDFDSKEFACPCCGGEMVDAKLIFELQELRDLVGKPVDISSGYRCKKENKRIGGYECSPHLTGLAVDIKVKGMSPVRLADIAKTLNNVRLGIYPNHLHIDVLPPRPSRYWLVKKYGQKAIYSGKERDLKKFLRNLI